MHDNTGMTGGNVFGEVLMNEKVQFKCAIAFAHITGIDDDNRDNNDNDDGTGRTYRITYQFMFVVRTYTINANCF